MNAGLLANLTCVQAELYEMEAAMSVGVNPQWVVPYATVADDYQDLLDDFSASVEVLYRRTHRRLRCMALLLRSNKSLPYTCCTVCVLTQCNPTAYVSWSLLQRSIHCCKFVQISWPGQCLYVAMNTAGHSTAWLCSKHDASHLHVLFVSWQTPDM